MSLYSSVPIKYPLVSKIILSFLSKAGVINFSNQSLIVVISPPLNAMRLPSCNLNISFLYFSLLN
jgi:hypothetical protein